MIEVGADLLFIVNIWAVEFWHSIEDFLFIIHAYEVI